MIEKAKGYPPPHKKAFYFPERNSKICAKCGEEKDVSLFFKHTATSDGWHSWCKPCCKEGNDKSREKKYSSFEGRVSTILQTCKRSAKARNNEYEITREDLMEMWELQGGKCAYTYLDMTTQANNPYSVSVERINSSIGYTKENTILVCNIINRMKSDFEPEMFYEMCRAVVAHLGDKKGKLAIKFKK
jgi:hypothetical protein